MRAKRESREPGLGSVGRRLLVVAGLLAAVAPGCTTSAPEQTNLMRQSGDVAVTATELRIRIRFFSSRFALIVEDAADRIIDASEDRSVQYAAVQWKSKIIPHAQTTCFLADPMAALFDTWALAIQQQDFFERDYARERLGDQIEIAQAAAERVVLEIEGLASAIKRDGDIEGSRAFVEQWAAEQSIEGPWMRRDSITPQLASALAASNLSMSATFSRLGEEFADLSLRVSLMNEFVPKQLRWQAELLAYELGLPELEVWTSATVADLHALAERAVVVAEQLESAADQQREALLEAAAMERELVLAQLTAEREEAQAFIDAMRDSTLTELTAEREIVLAALRTELAQALEQVALEREALTGDVERIAAAQWHSVRDDLPEVADQAAERAVERAGEPLAGLVDHAALRLAQVAGAGFVGLLLGGLVLIRVARR